MKMRRQRRGQGDARNIVRVLVCLLLFGLLIFNPFATLSSASAGLAYQAGPRHRATVGASEMQHFSPIQKDLALPDAWNSARVGDVKLTPAISVGRVILREE